MSAMSGMSAMEHVQGPFPWADRVDYSQAVVANGLVFVSGQYAAGENGEVVSEDFATQARMAFENLGLVLKRAGAGFDTLVQVRSFLLRERDFAAYQAIRREFLHRPFPATLAVCCGFSYPGMLIEIEAVALVTTAPGPRA